MFDITSNSTAVCVFYLLIFFGFVLDTVGCKLKTIMTKNIYLQHLAGFILLLFLVVLENPENADIDLWKKIIFAFLAYVFFITTTRCPLSIMCIVLLLILIVTILNSTKHRHIKEKDAEKAKKIHDMQIILSIIAISASLIGFVIYIIEKKLEYGKNFSLGKFIVGDINCREFTPEHAKILRI